ncbi:MAG TPA: DUF1338 domain-containing protein [Phycisphaerae bacterium]|jgi:hypothetical protein|nr:DUF1338 domain-containing protein [Phycisphaerae bacterium]HOB74864.1 DUF1338 domain-containing protein [Phycisphaerae bacterium]HOJ53726.1 DUF1338 domain-containing protein [Phycisphaerae bacterium]HOL27950.1 DUF1338 domain-containing protein [Phycisphaerae bacterium]HPP22214.1 DUF1338 domain-containing protein [Phycisphaerae bacterium]
MSASLILTQLLDRLWDNYCRRVEYARRYRDLVLSKGGRVVNDHIAFRTFNAPTGAQPSGIEAVARVITRLGYVVAGSYTFEDKFLTARHYEHSDRLLPKIFISQLEVDALPSEAAGAIKAAVADASDLLDSVDLARLERVAGLPKQEQAALVDRLYRFITQRPWKAPPRETVLEVNKASQYAAWTLLHANSVNHFTAYINEQQVPDWPDIEATVDGLRAAGIPMKDTIEGEPGSKLRQTATAAVDEDCEVTEADGRPGRLRWSYAYYELAERGQVPGPDGQPQRFNGFLGQQATHLFEMTRR